MLEMYKNKRVFITGVTGFKGTWLSTMLTMLGAEVYGYSLTPKTIPSHYEVLNEVGIECANDFYDIKDYLSLSHRIFNFSPHIIFHLSAQPLVRKSYETPLETFNTNVMGTANLMEVVRCYSKVENKLKAIVNITTDKVYKNKELKEGYVETDELGGHDPYSTSKACSELITESYRNSFFDSDDPILVATARAGNVIGGGDWSEDRIIPDIIKTKENVPIRMPDAIRPWQFVLEPLMGYLLLGEQLLKGNPTFASSWNFGPEYTDTFTVRDMCEKIKSVWPEISFDYSDRPTDKHETKTLKLDSTKAEILLKWKSLYSIDQTIEKTVAWYKAYYEDGDVLTVRQINDFMNDWREI